MYDYTPEGLASRQGDIAVSYLYLIDKKLAKINRKLTIITMFTVGAVLIKNKNVLKELKNMKGE